MTPYELLVEARAERDEAAFALRDVLAGKPVRNADEIIARSEAKLYSDKVREQKR